MVGTLRYGKVMERKLRIPTGRGDGPWFDVISGPDDGPRFLAGVADISPAGGCARFAGGCKGLDDDVREGMFPYFAHAFGDPEDPEAVDNFTGLVSSGGTLGGSPMVTNLPAYLGRLYNLSSIL